MMVKGNEIPVYVPKHRQDLVQRQRIFCNQMGTTRTHTQATSQCNLLQENKTWPGCTASMIQKTTWEFHIYT